MKSLTYAPLTQAKPGDLHVPELTNDDIGATKLPHAKFRCEQDAGARAFEGGCRAMWTSMAEVLAALVEQTKQKWGA